MKIDFDTCLKCSRLQILEHGLSYPFVEYGCTAVNEFLCKAEFIKRNVPDGCELRMEHIMKEWNEKETQDM